MNRSNWCTLLGTGLALASTFKILDNVAKKKAGASPALGAWLTAIAGLAVGTAIAMQPEKQMRKKLTVDNLLDETDLSRMHENISEVLENENE